MHKIIRQKLSLEPKNGYLHYHARRYASLLASLEQRYEPGQRVLEIGRSPFSAMAAEHLGAHVDTLGFGEEHETRHGRHWCFDLNHSTRKKKWRPDLPVYQHILFAEVVEHLLAPPASVLRFIRSLMDDAGWLYLQTPNAAVLHKRLQLLMGKNPYQELPTDHSNPGHFREYTRSEMLRFAAQADFVVRDCSYANYFDYRYSGHVEGRPPRPLFGAINGFYRLCPGGLKPGMMFILQPAR